MARRPSLRLRLIAPVVVLVVTMGASLQAVISAQLARQFDEVAQDRARDVAAVLASALQAPVEFEDTAAIEAALQPFRRAEGAAYAEVRASDGKSLATLTVDPEAVRADVGIGGILDDGAILHTAVAIPTAVDTPTPPRIVIGFSTAAREARMAAARASVLSMTAALVCVAAGIAWLIGRRLARPLEELSATASRIVEQQDLRIPIHVDSDDELGRLARALGDLVAAQRRTLAGLTGLAADVGKVSGDVDTAGAAVSTGAREIESQVETTARTVRQVRSALQGGDAETRAVLATADEVEALLLQLNGDNDRVASTLQQLAGEGQQTAAAVTRMTAVAEESWSRLSLGDQALEQAARTMKRVEKAAQDVERNAGQTRALSLRVREGAGAGRRLIVDVQGGVEAMGVAIDDVRTTVEGLAGRASQVELALQVIEDVAEQTALLSLNAAIIAAQAGEHGRGFGVVAHAIKELSDRTRSSVASIGGIIRQVTDEADAAVAAVGRSRDVVVDGTRRTADATAALETILADTSGATDRLEEIAVLTAEQLKGVREVAEALARVSETIGQIRRASQTQEAAARQLHTSARSLIELAGSADATLDGHDDRSRAASAALGRLGGIMRSLGESQARQAALLETVLRDVERIAAAGSRQQQPVRDLASSIAALRASASSLEAEAHRFLV